MEATSGRNEASPRENHPKVGGEESIPVECTILEKKGGEKVVPRKAKPPKKRRKHKPKDFPKRPLSAYNIFFKIFFKETRGKMLVERENDSNTTGVDFQSMVKEIAAKWKVIGVEERERLEKIANIDLVRYKEEVRVYEEEMVRRNRKEREEASLKKHEEEKAEACARLANDEREHVAAMRAATAREYSQLPRDQSLPHYVNHQERPSFENSLRTEGMRRILRPSFENSLRTEGMRRILEEELSIIDAARDMKLRQLAELQAGISPHSLTGGTGTGIGLGGGPSMGLPPGNIASDTDLDLLRRRQALSLGLTGGLPAGTHHQFASPAELGGLGGGLDTSHGAPGGGLGALSTYSDLPTSSALALSRQDLARREVILRNLQEREEFFASRFGRAPNPSAFDKDPTPRHALSSSVREMSAIGRGPSLLHEQHRRLYAGAAGARHLHDDSGY